MSLPGPHLQEVLSPTPGQDDAGAVSSLASQHERGGGDASQTMVNGTTAVAATGAGLSQPTELEQPSGGEAQQTTMISASSGPTSFTALSAPTPQLPQEVRTGGDGTSSQVGSLGTTGATCGAVSTGDVVDASGVHGDATGEVQGPGVATASGMASSQANAIPGISGHNPPAPCLAVVELCRQFRLLGCRVLSFSLPVCRMPTLENLEGLPRKPPYKGKSSDLAEWAPGFIRAIVAAIKNWNGWYRVSKASLEEWREHVRSNHTPFRRDCSVCIRTAGTGRCHTGVVHPAHYTLSADVCGPLRMPGVFSCCHPSVPTFAWHAHLAKTLWKK